MRTSTAIALGSFLAGFSACPAIALCDKDTISSVSADGTIVRLNSGKSYRVESDDTLASLQWREDQDVSVCRDRTIINEDESGEHIEANRLDTFP